VATDQPLAIVSRAVFQKDFQVLLRAKTEEIDYPQFFLADRTELASTLSTRIVATDGLQKKFPQDLGRISRRFGLVIKFVEAVWADLHSSNHHETEGGGTNASILMFRLIRSDI